MVSASFASSGFLPSFVHLWSPVGPCCTAVGRTWFLGQEAIRLEKEVDRDRAMIREPKDVLDDVRMAVSARGGESLSGILVEFVVGLCMYEQFPEDAFARLAALLGEPMFWAHENAWELVREVDSSWELFTAAQRAELRPLLVSNFDKWANPMGAFVIGEILGGRYGDQDALDALSRLAEVASMPARALVPHGLEVLARNSSNAELRRRSIEKLRWLKTDKEGQVREEACISLGKVGEE